MINQMQRTLIKHAKIVNEGAIFEGDILIDELIGKFIFLYFR